MYHILMAVYVVFLFVILTPGVLVRLPARGSLLSAAIVHGILFVIICHFTHKLVWRATYGTTEAMYPIMRK
jgi:hypothetical protein